MTTYYIIPLNIYINYEGNDTKENMEAIQIIREETALIWKEE